MLRRRICSRFSKTIAKVGGEGGVPFTASPQGAEFEDIKSLNIPDEFNDAPETARHLRQTPHDVLVVDNLRIFFLKMVLETFHPGRNKDGK